GAICSNRRLLLSESSFALRSSAANQCPVSRSQSPRSALIESGRQVKRRSPKNRDRRCEFFLPERIAFRAAALSELSAIDALGWRLSYEKDYESPFSGLGCFVLVRHVF